MLPGLNMLSEPSTRDRWILNMYIFEFEGDKKGYRFAQGVAVLMSSKRLGHTSQSFFSVLCSLEVNCDVAL